MGQIVAGMASSHAYTFLTPDQWDKRREISRAGFERRNGRVAPVQPQVEQETLASNLKRYEQISGGLNKLKETLDTLQPDVLVLIGDDQNELYREHLPQFAIYTGERCVSIDREHDLTAEHRCDPELATHILNSVVEDGFDLASSSAFPEDKLISHAHAQVLSFLNPKMAVLPVFVNSIHVPSPNPARCHEFGQSLGRAIASFPGNRRAALYASGGLSHFSQGYPYKHYSGPFSLGSISEQFDKRVVDWMRTGQGTELKTLTSRDLIDNGEIELRCWITMLGALGNRKPEWLVYEPFYRGIMGMSVGYWPLN
jgi:aromatic ring-opening dioxygenase LigB subunit